MLGVNGFIGTLAAQLALQPVSPAADGIASCPRRPVAECLRAQRTARAKLTAPSRRSAYLQQLRRVWWADSAAAPTAAAGHRRIPRMGSGGVRWERACCPLRSRRVALLAICCRGASSGGRAWRHMPANCIPRRPAHSNVCSQCALGRSATARCPRNAFPSAWRWRYVDVMRSRVSDDDNILPRCIPKKASDGKRAPSWQYIAAVYSK